MHKISKLVCFAAPLNTRQAYDLRQSGHESFYSVAGRAARANFDALAACGVNVNAGERPAEDRRNALYMRAQQKQLGG